MLDGGRWREDGGGWFSGQMVDGGWWVMEGGLWVLDWWCSDGGDGGTSTAHCAALCRAGGLVVMGAGGRQYSTL